jgi:hypothetical protein
VLLRTLERPLRLDNVRQEHFFDPEKETNMNSGTRFLSVALIAGVTLLACQTGDPAGEKQPAGENESSGSAAAKSGGEASAHAPAKAKPGSHEDWCGEHQVPESLCTQCNPTLVAAFKATGDWCAEHNLPESQCRLCHPDLKIERPPKLESED